MDDNLRNGINDLIWLIHFTILSILCVILFTTNNDFKELFEVDLSSLHEDEILPNQQNMFSLKG